VVCAKTTDEKLEHFVFGHGQQMKCIDAMYRNRLSAQKEQGRSNLPLNETQNGGHQQDD
jgi:hypothetical protein